jgi:hypothetical protein
MTKTVFDGRMCAHVWAQQSQPEGRNNNGQFFFKGPTIYSYGSHFPIATFKTTKRGQRYVLFTTRDYSITTSKHKGFARNAIHDETIFYIPRPTGPDTPRQQYEAEIDAATRVAATEAAKGKRYAKRALAALGLAAGKAEAANEYAAFVGERWRLKVPGVTAEALADASVAHERAVKAAARKAAKAEKERAEEQRELQAAWLAGDEPRYSSLRGFDAACGGAALRVMGEDLETSHGARVPLKHAVKVFPFLKLCREEGKTWEKNGHSIRVGHFTLDRIEADGSFKAGCHEIRWPEVERIAKQIGIFDVAPARDALEKTKH